MPDSHHMSWSSRYVAEDHWCTRTASTFSSPRRTTSVMSNSLASRLPLVTPSSTPFNHTRPTESMPSKRSSIRSTAQSAGTAKVRR